MTPEKIVECPDCGKEICLSLSVIDDLIFITQEEKPKPKPNKPKPKPIIEPKPKPIKSKPKPIIESKPEFNLSQLSQAEITATNGLKEFSNEIKQEIKEVFTLEKDYNETIKSLQFAEETIIQQKEEITNLEVEMAFAKGIRKRPFTFKEFSEYMLSQSKSSGSNSMKLGEIAYRKTSLKNIFLIILHLRDVNQL